MKPRNRRALWLLGIALVVHWFWQWQMSSYSRPANVHRVVRDLLSPQEEVRMEAKNALAEMGTNAVPHLWRLYTVTNAPSLKSQLAGWLGMHTTRRRPPESTERRLGYEGLKALGPEAVAISSNLVVELQQDAQRVGHATSLLMSIGPGALPAITPALTTGTPQTKEQLLYVINHYGPAASPAVVDVVAIVHGTDAKLRQIAAATLARIQGLPFLSVPALTTLLSDTNSETRQVALHALSAYGQKASPVLDQVRQLVSTAPLDSSERLAAVGLLLTMNERSLARAEVLHLLESANPTNRLWALTNLTEVQLAWPEIGHLASRFLSDPDPSVREHSALELGQVVRQTGYPETFIAAGLAAAPAEVRLAFLKTAWKADAALLPMTIRALGDTDARVCRAAALSLTGLDFSTKPAQPALAALLDHADRSVRRDAYHALHNSDHRLFPMLVPWPLDTPTERTINALVRLHVLGSSAVADTNHIADAAGRLSQQFAPLLGALTRSGRLNLIPSLKVMLSEPTGLGPPDAADKLAELAVSHPEARAAVLELLRSSATPANSIQGLRMALGFKAAVTMSVWMELAERAEPNLRREALLHIAGASGVRVEQAIPLLLKAASDSDVRVRELATGLLRRFPADVVNRHREASPSSR